MRHFRLFGPGGYLLAGARFNCADECGLPADGQIFGAGCDHVGWLDRFPVTPEADRPTIWRDLSANPQLANWAEGLPAGAAMCALPLRAEDRSAGVLYVASSAPGAFDEEEVRLLAELGGDILFGLRVLRDPTRGGLAATLNEIARQSGVGIVLDEMALPVDPQVAAACEFLGLDPLHIANEGKLIAICGADEADALVAALRAHPLGARAARVGEVCADERCFVQMKTALGARRMVDWLAGEQLPRIC